MKGFFTILLTKIIIFALKIAKKNGGNLPGKYAYKWNPNIFKYFKINCPVIAVVGTNGKTMTNNTISSILSKSGANVISNLKGNNMETGILSLLIKKSTLTGKIKADYITLEVDESYLPVTFKDLRLDTLVVLNFFRDQLDRVGEVESLILKINDFFKTYQGNLVLNNDDPNVARLGKANPDNKNIYYFSVDKYKFATEKMKEAGEGKFCPFCSTRLKYEYYQYAHIGKFKCLNCDYGNNEIYKFITDVDLENKTFKIGEDTFKIQFNSIYSVYNFAAAVAATSLYNIKLDDVKQTLEKFVLNNGRQEKLVINNCETTINLAKNPTGANVSLRLVNEDNDPKDVLFVLNDNLADGKDVSWIYDIDFSNLNNVNRIITSGTRAYDIAICIKTSGFPASKIEAYLDLNEAVKALYATSCKKYAISNYTAIQDTRHAIMSLKNTKGLMNMKEIRVLYLYPDILDLYGDIGNIKVLKYRLEQRGFKAVVDSYSINDEKPDFKSYDIIFSGGGADNEQQILSDDLVKYKEDIKQALEAGVFFLLICGSYQLFGKYYKGVEGNIIPGLEIFDYYTEANPNRANRCIGNIVLEAELNGAKTKVIGFENHGGQTFGIDTPFGKVLYGNGNKFGDTEEGFMQKNVIATYLHGPLLSKNPVLTDYIIKYCLERKYNESIELEPLNDELENKCRLQLFNLFIGD